MDINKYSPKGRMSTKHVFSVSDLEEGDIYEILHLARKLKQKQQVKEKLGVFEGKNVAIMLKSSSSRIRISFELAINRIGGKTLYLSPADEDFYRGLTYLDAAHILGAYGVNGLVAKDLSAEAVAQLKNNPLPVINLKEGRDSACQVLANLYTVWETTGRLSGVKYAALGNFRKPATEGVNAYVKCGVEVTLCAPEALLPSGEALRGLVQFGDVVLATSALQAVKNADVITTVWDGGGDLAGYAVTEDLFGQTSAKYLHVLPVRHGEEVADSVLYGARSAVFARAANLIYVEQAMVMLYFR